MIKGRYKRIEVCNEVFEELLKIKSYEQTRLLNPLPDDAKCVFSEGVPERGNGRTIFYFESKEWDEVEVMNWRWVPPYDVSIGRVTDD